MESYCLEKSISISHLVSQRLGSAVVYGSSSGCLVRGMSSCAGEIEGGGPQEGLVT